ncbi:hypothetical protein QVD17_07078 [Tagetes erecta]|uniref:RNA-directed DNA polymerase, eukaryota, reverse transcriptase zinc-binding domain protein n=1 Tax=Tagetes erecta TaxID=13708 RepID=A0AAD8LPP5_TARER|nr:hypothetical protein QVD17_07078 [Tagetes erecta]
MYLASLDEERFLKQKSKVHWLAEGDANTKYFHNTLKCRNHRARIDVITDSNGILHEGKAVPKAFVDHYVGFLGKEEVVTIPITQELFDVRIDQAMSVDMIREVTVDEIKRTIFAFADDKAPGPDGFTAAFYKKAWDIVDFADMSGLSASNQKSTIFFCNVPAPTKNSILNIMPFVEGKLPVRVASLDEERFLKQKSKVHWLAEGDANTKYFHNTLKCRNHRARIDVITDSYGILHEGKAVPKAFVDHYVGFLGKEEDVIIPITQELFDVRIDQAI